MYIKGIGHTRFSKTKKSSHLLAYDAAMQALDGSGMTIDEIDMIIVSNTQEYTGHEHQRHPAAIISSIFKTKIPVICIPAVCAGGGVAFYTANQQDVKNVLVIGYESLSHASIAESTQEIMNASENMIEQQEGLNFPAANALIAQQMMQNYGVTEEDLAKVSLKNHVFASKNPLAGFYGKTTTIEKIMASPMVCSPLRLFHCSMTVDGAAAVVLSQEKTDIEVVGSGMSVEGITFFERPSLTSWPAVRTSSEQAYKMAGITPDNLDVAELHDAFSSVELLLYEDLGFCKEGKAKELIRTGYTDFGGKLPCNTSGGLTAKGHPISVTGLSQIYQLVKQLRGECKDFQVDDARVGLACNVGGAGATATTHILRKAD